MRWRLNRRCFNISWYCSDSRAEVLRDSYGEGYIRFSHLKAAIVCASAERCLPTFGHDQRLRIFSQWLLSTHSGHSYLTRVPEFDGAVSLNALLSHPG